MPSPPWTSKLPSLGKNPVDAPAQPHFSLNMNLYVRATYPSPKQIIKNVEDFPEKKIEKIIDQNFLYFSIGWCTPINSLMKKCMGSSYEKFLRSNTSPPSLNPTYSPGTKAKKIIRCYCFFTHFFPVSDQKFFSLIMSHCL